MTVTLPTNETVSKPVAAPPPEPPAGADPRPADETRVGTILKGKYQLDQKIGEGGMGVVFRAIDLEAVNATSLVAIKLIRPALRTPATIEALYLEVEQTRRLRDDNIVSVYSFENDSKSVFMVMEYLVGRPLDKLIADDYALGMPLKMAWPIIHGMGTGLAHAHRRGTIHSDFKPSNVYVTAGGAKVLDFGIARAAAGGRLVGMTKAYASCDMWEGMPPDARDDVFAFGLVVYKLLSGKHPFCQIEGTDECAITWREDKMPVAPIQGLTHRQRQALRGALQFDRARRTAGIQEVLDGLEKPAWPKGWLIALLLLLSIVLGLGAFSAYRWFGPQDSDAHFVEQLLSTGATPMAGVDATTIKQLLELGDDYLRTGLKPFNPVLLSENASPLSCALSVYREVLKADPHNKAAAKGILSIVNAYKAEAQRLFGNEQFDRAEQMAKIGLRIWPDSIDLAKLDAQIRPKLDPSASPSP
jgi:protein kinase-like protein